MTFKEHKLEWTEEKINNFWNYYTKKVDLESTWFTNMVGEAIVRITSKFLNKDDKVLDYGTGKGYLIKYLLKQKYSNITACDFSEASVQTVNEKYNGENSFKNCFKLDKLPSSIPSSTFNAVYFLEVIEHLIDEFYSNSLTELNRILEIGGICIITTPNSENLDAESVICADCGAVFHKMQHVRSFNAGSLSKEMENYGFTSIFCKSMNLGDFLSKNEFKRLIKRVYSSLFNKKFSENNLLYIGKKTKHI